jgi:hypothetical protein
MSTVVYTRGGGRLGNQLLNYVNLLAFQQEYPAFDVLNLAFERYADTYVSRQLPLSDIAGTAPNGSLGWLIRTFWGSNPVGSVAHYDPIDQLRHQAVHYHAHRGRDSQSLIGGIPNARFHVPGNHRDGVDLSSSETVEKLRSVGTTVLAGWNVRAWPLIEIHGDWIRETLQPDEQYVSAAKSFITDIRAEYDTVVGVLIRQDDYRTFMNGRFFYESARYRELIEAYATTHCAGNTAFVLASDEAQSHDLFDEEAYHFCTGEAVGPNHFLENFVELSLCDMILSPPSTFSLLAAFLGDIPLVPIACNEADWTHLDRPLLDSLTHEQMRSILYE